MTPLASAWLENDQLAPGVIVVGLGGNLDGPTAVQARFDSALASLASLWGPPIVSSSLVTKPVGPVQDQPDFLNCVAAF